MAHEHVRTLILSFYNEWSSLKYYNAFDLCYGCATWMTTYWVLLLLSSCTRLNFKCNFVGWLYGHKWDMAPLTLSICTTMMVLCSRVFIQCYWMKLLRNLYPCKCFIVVMAMMLHVVKQGVVCGWTSKVWDIHTRTFPVGYPRSDWRFGAVAGKFLSIVVGQDPCDSISIRLHVDIIFRCFFHLIWGAFYRFLSNDR